MKVERVYSAVAKCWATLEVALIFGICSIFYYIPGEFV